MKDNGMKSEKSTINYWFTIEPYVYVGLTDKSVVLYNTLDGVTLESSKLPVIELFNEMLQRSNCGVTLLSSDRYGEKDVFDFVRELRENYMGDIIDVSLSKGKPVQLLPLFNFLTPHEIYKKLNSHPYKDVLGNLFEVSFHIDYTTNISTIISFLKSLEIIPCINLIGNMQVVANYNELFTFLDQFSSPLYIICSYLEVFAIPTLLKKNTSYKVSINFPINLLEWTRSRNILLNQALPVEYIFNVSSEEDCLQAEQMIEQFRLDKYQILPLYTGNNIPFFEKNVYLTKEDILSTSMSIKDFFTHQSINIFDFGKLNIKSNGDIYANINHPVLGNIHTQSIYEIVYKEMKEGISWFNIRNQSPCTNCVYQWFCPPPSNYEILIGRPNLCHIKN